MGTYLLIAAITCAAFLLCSKYFPPETAPVMGLIWPISAPVLIVLLVAFLICRADH